MRKRSDDDDGDDDVSQRAEGSGCSQPLRSRQTPHTEPQRSRRGAAVSPHSSHRHSLTDSGERADSSPAGERHGRCDFPARLGAAAAAGALFITVRVCVRACARVFNCVSMPPAARARLCACAIVTIERSQTD